MLLLNLSIVFNCLTHYIPLISFYNLIKQKTLMILGCIERQQWNKMFLRDYLRKCIEFNFFCLVIFHLLGYWACEKINSILR